jgi:hypothetical protein
MQAYSATFIIYITFALEWEVHQILIYSVLKKPFVSAEWQNSTSTTRPYPVSHAFIPHRHKNWFRSLDARKNGSHWFAQSSGFSFVSRYLSRLSPRSLFYYPEDGSSRVLRNVGNSDRLLGVARQMTEIRVVAVTKN